MAQQINDNFKLNAPRPLDYRYLKASGATAVPYSSVVEANAYISQFYRYPGLTILIDDGSNRSEYWYLDGTSDGDLVEKSFGIPTLATVAYTGDYTDLLNTPDLSLYYLASNPAGYISGIDSQDVTDALGFIPEDSSLKGLPNGYASLDSAGKVPANQLPNAILKYKGTWDADTNTPTLADGVGDAGDVYRVSVAGIQDLGSGPIDFQVGDYVIYNGTIWEISDTTDAVSSVNGYQGVVVLDTDDIAEGTTNRYYTDSRVQAYSDPRYLQIPTGTTNQYIRGNGSLGNIGQGLIVNGNDLTLDLNATTLVSPTISTSWTLYRNDGTTPYVPPTSTSKTLIVDKGVRAFISSTYQYPAAGAGQSLPIAVTGNYGTTLPGPATPSSPPFTNGGTAITSNTQTTNSYSVTLSKPKSGLVVSGSQVVFASGNDTTTDTTSISFQGRGVMTFNTATSLSAAQIEAVYNATIDTGTNTNGAKFQTTRARTFASVTASGGTYTYYLLDNALGQPTNVIQNGALPVFGAFQFLSNVTITNAAGISIPIIVMRSNATDAFTAASLAFS